MLWWARLRNQALPLTRLSLLRTLPNISKLLSSHLCTAGGRYVCGCVVMLYCLTYWWMQAAHMLTTHVTQGCDRAKAVVQQLRSWKCRLKCPSSWCACTMYIEKQQTPCIQFWENSWRANYWDWDINLCMSRNLLLLVNHQDLGVCEPTILKLCILESYKCWQRCQKEGAGSRAATRGLQNKGIYTLNKTKVLSGRSVRRVVMSDNWQKCSRISLALWGGLKTGLRLPTVGGWRHIECVLTTVSSRDLFGRSTG